MQTQNTSDIFLFVCRQGEVVVHWLTGDRRADAGGNRSIDVPDVCFPVKTPVLELRGAPPIAIVGPPNR